MLLRRFLIELHGQLRHKCVCVCEREDVTTAPGIKKYCKEVKDKAVPLQAWSGPEVSRKLRFPDFMTTAQVGGKVVSHTHRPPLPQGNPPGTHFC